MTAPLLSVTGLAKRYGDVVALDGIDLDIDDGEFVALLGPSGCGKTTMLKLIAGFEPASGGRVTLDGDDLLPLPPHRRPVNTVFQRYLLFPHLDVAQNVAYGLRFDGTPRAEARARLAEALELVRLGEFAGRRSDQLSGGQAQRVSLARALVKRPRLLLLDEPLSALDLGIRLEMQRELRRIHREIGMTFLFVTHDQHEAMALADRIVVMQGGRIEQVGTPTEIYHQPATRFVAQFVGDANLVPYTLERRNGTAHAVALAGTFATPLDDDAPPHGVLLLRPEQLTLEPAAADAAGRVTDVAFSGAAVTYSIAFGDTVVRVSDQGAPAPTFALDDAVAVHARAGTVLALA